VFFFLFSPPKLWGRKQFHSSRQHFLFSFFHSHLARLNFCYSTSKVSWLLVRFLIYDSICLVIKTSYLVRFSTFHFCFFFFLFFFFFVLILSSLLSLFLLRLLLPFCVPYILHDFVIAPSPPCAFPTFFFVYLSSTMSSRSCFSLMHTLSLFLFFLFI